jgi:hypothetical protein
VRGVRQGGAAFGKDAFVKVGGVRQGGWRSSRRVAFVKAGGVRQGEATLARSKEAFFKARRRRQGGVRQCHAAVVKATPMSSRRGGSRQGNVSKEAFVKVGRL